MNWIQTFETKDALIVELKFHKSKGLYISIILFGILFLGFLPQAFLYPLFGAFFGLIFVILFIVTLLPLKTILTKFKGDNKFSIKYVNLFRTREIIKTEFPKILLIPGFNIKKTFDLKLVFSDEIIMPYSKGAGFDSIGNTEGMFNEKEVDQIVEFLKLKYLLKK